MKKRFDAVGVTEHPVGPHLGDVQALMVNGAVILAIDVSGSMERHLPAAVQGGLDFMDEAIGGGYQVGVLLWDHEVVAFEPPAREADRARELLSRADSRGGTNVVPALELAHDQLMRLDVGDRVVAIFGDGHLGKAERAAATAAKLVADGIRILTCGLGADSADALALISTESIQPRTASTETLTRSIAGMATGLRLR